MQNALEGKPTIPLDVKACRDCRYSVPGVNADGFEAEDTSRCTAPPAATLGTPYYHLALAEAPLCSTVRLDEACGSEAKLFQPMA